MKLIRQNPAAELLDALKTLVGSLTPEERKKLIEFPKEVCRELEETPLQSRAEEGARVHAS